MNKQDIRNRLAASVGGEEKLAGFFSARTMRCTRTRAQRELDGAAETCAETIERVQAAIDKAGLAEYADFEPAEFVDRFTRKWAAYQHAGSRVLNWMVTGPARFPTRSNEKRMNTEHNRLTEYIDFYNGAPAAEVRKAKRARAQALGPAGLACGELEDAQRNLAKRERNQTYMKAVNALIRKHKLGRDDAEQLAELAEAANIDMPRVLARSLLTPDYGKPGFAAFQLSNNNAEIRRLKQRVEQLQNKVTAIESAGDTCQERELAGVRLVENVALDRVQLIFPDKPSSEARSTLKARGFRWAPSQGAWQRQLTAAGVRNANYVLEQLAAA